MTQILTAVANALPSLLQLHGLCDKALITVSGKIPSQPSIVCSLISLSSAIQTNHLLKNKLCIVFPLYLKPSLFLLPHLGLSFHPHEGYSIHKLSAVTCFSNMRSLQHILGHIAVHLSATASVKLTIVNA